MIYLLDRTQIISHSVNKSEIHPALSEIAKFISLSIQTALIFRFKLFSRSGLVTFCPIEVVLVVVFCCLIYSYKNRTQEIKQNNNIINGSLTFISIVSNNSSSSRPFYWIIFKEANLYYNVFR